MRPRALSVVLLAGWAALPSFPWSPHLPTWMERWLYNPRERTAGAIEAYEAGEPERAADLADTALRLAPEDPKTRFNAGTAHLAAGRERRAIALLEKAVSGETGKDPELAPAAHYNLGNARLSARDAAGAVEAYKQALRLAPDDANAKHNLELALREREKQRQRMRGPGEGSRGRRPQGKREPSGGGGQSGPPNQDPSRSNDPGRQEQPQGQGRPQDQGQRPNQGGQGSALPRFQNQPDMNAQEAAALLQAVENLERQQRRQQAAQRARQQSARGKDW